MNTTPFKRAMAMMAALSAAISSGMSHSMASASLGAYVSRGHGQGKRSGKKAPNSCTPWLVRLKGQTNGKRECERRMRQAGRLAG